MEDENWPYAGYYNSAPAALIFCAECFATWSPGSRERWRAYLTNDEPTEVALLCPTCSAPESGAAS